MVVKFKMEKVTKNTVRFEEVLESGLAAPKIGSIYVPKSTLGDLKWDGEQPLVIEIRTEG